MLRNLAWLIALAVTLSCGRPSRTKRKDASIAASAPSPSAATAHKRAEIEPAALLALPIGAFHVTLWSDEESVYLLTSQGAYRFVTGQEPRHFALDLGEGPVMTRSSFIYWSSGSNWRTPKSGGEPLKLASVPQRPHSKEAMRRLQSAGGSRTSFAYGHYLNAAEGTLAAPSGGWKSIGKITVTLLRSGGGKARPLNSRRTQSTIDTSGVLLPWPLALATLPSRPITNVTTTRPLRPGRRSSADS